MKFITVLFIFFSFSVAKLLYINSDGEIPDIELPVLTIPEFEFLDTTGGCSAFTDCIEYVGAVLYNIGVGIVFFVLFIINLVVYFFKFVALLAKVSFSSIEGAPAWVSAIMLMPLLVMGGLSIYKMVRSGRSEA